MIYQKSFNWTAEHIARLKDLWEEQGLSAAQIADVMGISRSAVLGKANRLEFTKKTTSTSQPRRFRAKSAPQPHLGPARVGSRKGGLRSLPSDDPGIPEPTVEIDIPVEQRKTLLQLTEQTCKWPVGHPQAADFYFCGGITDNAPYCSHHSSIAYDTPASRHRAAQRGGRPRIDIGF